MGEVGEEEVGRSLCQVGEVGEEVVGRSLGPVGEVGEEEGDPQRVRTMEMTGMEMLSQPPQIPHSVCPGLHPPLDLRSPSPQCRAWGHE